MRIWDLIFPRTCIGCGRWGAYICSQCLNKMKKQERQVCPMCDKPAMWGMTHAVCRRAWGMEGVVAVLEYRGLVNKMIRKIKYKGVTDMYQALVEVLVSWGDFEPLGGKEWLVVAVPLHKRRLASRGFNQAEMLAERLALYFGWEYWPGVLERKRNTKPQVSLGRKERLVNVKNAFGLNSKMQNLNYKIKGKKILLVDDVWTTGATMRECAKELKKAGVSEVWGLAAAS